MATEDSKSNIVKDSEGKVVSGEVTQYSKSGKLAAIVNVTDYKLNGPARKYYEDGETLRSELNYKMGKLDGLQKRYYESGGLYKEEMYSNGKRDGLIKKYRESGMLMTEAIYKNGEPGTELKEYLTDGSLKKKYPSIVIDEVDNLRLNGTYQLNVYMSDKAKKVDYYFGELEEGKYFSKNLKKQYNVTDGVLKLVFYLKPGDFMMEDINIVARMPTRLNNAFITSRRHRIGIEFPLY